MTEKMLQQTTLDKKREKHWVYIHKGKQDNKGEGLIVMGTTNKTHLGRLIIMKNYNMALNRK